MPRTKTSGSFKPGQSGNPGGKKPSDRPQRNTSPQARVAKALMADANAERVKKGERGNLMPLDFALQVLRTPSKYPFAARQWATHEALPYLHKKMPVAIEMVGNDIPQPIKITIEFKDSAKPTEKGEE